MPDAPSSKQPSTSYLSRAKEKARGSSKKTKVHPKGYIRERTPEEWAAERVKIEHEAATHIQSTYVANVANAKKEKKRVLLQRKTAGAASMGLEKVQHIKLDLEHRLGEATHDVTFGHVQKFISSYLRQQVRDDPWLPNGAQDATLETVDKIIAEVKRRTLNEVEETSGKGGIRINKQMARLVMPETWPLPPLRTSPLAWLRARFLYALFPADKNETYRRSIAPWMSVVELCFYLPYGISTATWLLYILVVLFTVDDLYQLFTCILNFRCFAFIFWGTTPIVFDWFQMYISFSGGDTFTHVLEHSLDVPGDNDFTLSLHLNNLHPNSLLVEGGPSTTSIDKIQDRVFILNWVLCWVVFAKYKWRRSQYLSGKAEPPLFTGDRDRGDIEQNACMAYDFLVTCAIALLASLDLTYRILRLSGFKAYFVTLVDTFFLRPFHCSGPLHMPHAVDIFFSALTTAVGQHSAITHSASHSASHYAPHRASHPCIM